MQWELVGLHLEILQVPTLWQAMRLELQSSIDLWFVHGKGLVI